MCCASGGYNVSLGMEEGMIKPRGGAGTGRGLRSPGGEQLVRDLGR